MFRTPAVARARWIAARPEPWVVSEWDWAAALVQAQVEAWWRESDAGEVGWREGQSVIEKQARFHDGRTRVPTSLQLTQMPCWSCMCAVDLKAGRDGGHAVATREMA